MGTPLERSGRTRDAALAPESWNRGSAWRRCRARGRVYGPIPEELAEQVVRWLASGPTSELEPLKPPWVFRRGELVVKFFPRVSLFDRVRPARAVRVAELYFRCLPVPSPRPLLAAGHGPGRASLLVREHLSGELLTTAWRADEHATRALVPFLFGMHSNGVFHGDLHPRNLIWTADAWHLLDVEGVRHRLHSAPRVVEGQWARLLAHLDDLPGLERAYRDYRALARNSAGNGQLDAWPRILLEAGRLARLIRPPQPGAAAGDQPSSRARPGAEE